MPYEAKLSSSEFLLFLIRSGGLGTDLPYKIQPPSRNQMHVCPSRLTLIKNKNIMG